MDDGTKPDHLGPNYAAQFQDASVVDAYQYRPPYPPETFSILTDLMVDRPRRVLDLGCGRGEIARQLVLQVDQVDAIDWSSAMIRAGRQLPGGDDPRLLWICSRAEEAPLRPPYSLITAGSSLHWMNWDVLFFRLATALTARGYLAIVDLDSEPAPWDEELTSLIRSFSTNQAFRPYRLVDEPDKRGLFETAGLCKTAAVPFSQTVEEFVESIHSRNGFSRQRMTKEAALAFDNRVRELVSPYTVNEELQLMAAAVIVWGRPLPKRAHV